MAQEFKPVRFLVMMAVAALLVCGVTAFYTHRATHGRTSEEWRLMRWAENVTLVAARQARSILNDGLRANV